MATNLALDDSLLKKAMTAGSFRTKRETVNTALKEFIDRRSQNKILDIEGTVSFRADWDYKKERNGREHSR